MTTPTLDRWTVSHLHDWCDRVFRQPEEATGALEEFINGMSDEDRAHYLEAGWRALADRFAAEDPEHYEVFNS